MAPVTREEIKATLFSLNGNKAPGSDGFTTQFFKDSWEIIGDSVLSAIEHFFSTSQMDRQVNATIIALIPKKMNAS